MNILIINKLSNNLKTLNISIEKELVGSYSIDDIITTFSNFDFSKLIIDVTAIKDIDDPKMLQKLASNIDVNKIILVFEDLNNTALISKLISFGIYNFTPDANMVPTLITTPNTYKEVAHFHELASQNNQINKTRNTRIIGFKNLTKNAGATSLIYMSKKYLEQFYQVLAIEINREDFEAYRKNDESFVSCKEEEFITNLDKYVNNDIIFVDINDSKAEIYCSDVFYLIEPSVIKIEQFKKYNNPDQAFLDKKIILNKSFLTSSELSTFQYEGRVKVFFNLPNLNDREIKHPHLIAFYKKIGIDKRNARKIKRH